MHTRFALQWHASHARQSACTPVGTHLQPRTALRVLGPRPSDHSRWGRSGRRSSLGFPEFSSRKSGSSSGSPPGLEQPVLVYACTGAQGTRRHSTDEPWKCHFCPYFAPKAGLAGRSLPRFGDHLALCILCANARMHFARFCTSHACNRAACGWLCTPLRRRPESTATALKTRIGCTCCH